MDFFIDVVILDQDLPLPKYSKDGDAGMDLCYSGKDRLVINPTERMLVPTGISLAIPRGYAGFVHPRSGLANKSGVTVANSPGTIDSGYRGEIKVNLINLGQDVFIISPYDRIAQLVIQPVVSASFHIVSELSSSERGIGGHGSTGVGRISL